MSVSAMDTAKLPRSRAETPAPPPAGAVRVVEAVAPLVPVPEPAPGRRTREEVARPVPPVVDRRALREERRQVKRQQRRYALAGVAFLAAVFLVAVIVLGGIR